MLRIISETLMIAFWALGVTSMVTAAFNRTQTYSKPIYWAAVSCGAVAVGIVCFHVIFFG